MARALLINDARFTVDALLGKGKSGYSYLVRDDAGAPFVIKQIHHEPCDYYEFGDKLASELAAYERLSCAGVPMPALLDVDRERERILKEFVEGHTVFELVLSERLGPELVDAMGELAASVYGHGLNIDYFPTNFVVADGCLVYIDYECNDYDERWDFEHWGIRYWSKTPEFLDYLAQAEREPRYRKGTIAE